MRLWSVTVGLLLVVVSCGCSSQPGASHHDTERSHLRMLLYFHALAVRQGNPPANEEQFKQTINGFDPTRLDRAKASNRVSSIDELFFSERDGEPYVFFYGRQPAGVASDLLAYERTGVGGIRFVGYGLGIVEAVDEERFAELVPEDVRPAE